MPSQEPWRATKPTHGAGLTARNDEHRASSIRSQDNRPRHDQKMNNTRNPRTPEPPKRRRPKKNTTDTDAEEAADALQQALGLLEPVIDFHKPVEGATEDDLRIYWDVRVVRGQDSPFAHVTGSSSLPMALASNTKALAPTVIQAELLEKVSRPLTAVLQTETEQQTMDELAARNGGSCLDAGAAEPLP
jgi:hypothetical protein